MLLVYLKDLVRLTENPEIIDKNLGSDTSRHSITTYGLVVGMSLERLRITGGLP
jgi:hypothetical protein